MWKHRKMSNPRARPSRGIADLARGRSRKPDSAADSCILIMQWCVRKAGRTHCKDPMRPLVLVIASLSVSVACAGTESNQRSNTGRGSEECHVWQDAACDHFADRCGALPRDICDEQYQSVTCRSDAVAKTCAAELKTAACGAATADCLIDSVADVQPATDACNSLFERFCERSTTCGASDSMDMCLADPNMTMLCLKAVGFRLDFEKCLDEIDMAACESFSLPQICSDVIIARL
jgi:hypothetical protein